MDFIELDSPDGFNIYDIVLETGKSGISYADAIPKEGRGDPQALQGKMPDVELAMGKTRLTVHLLGYRKDLGVTSLELILNKFLTEEQEEIVAPIDENGDCRFEFEQLGTYEGFLGDGNHVYANTILFPGEEAEVYGHDPIGEHPHSHGGQGGQDLVFHFLHNVLLFLPPSPVRPARSKHPAPSRTLFRERDLAKVTKSRNFDG